MGAHIWLRELCERDDVGSTVSLCSESTGVLASVDCEDDVKFFDLCEARGMSVLRNGVIDNSGTLEIQDISNFNLGGLASAHSATFAELFG